MAIINNAAPVPQTQSNGMGFFLGVLLLLVVGFFLVYYGGPLIRSTYSTPQVNIPGKIDVNVNK
jgi:hypothetical protein